MWIGMYDQFAKQYPDLAVEYTPDNVTFYCMFQELGNHMIMTFELPEDLTCLA
jgi:hypothetical protein